MLEGGEPGRSRVRYETKRKPRRCPACGGRRVASILWGMPAMSDALRAKLEAGRIVLGGCCVSSDDPSWFCLDCETSIYPAGWPRPAEDEDVQP